MEGSGGATSTGPELEAGRRGDWSRNVRVDMEAELLARRRPFRLVGRRLGTPLAWDETEALRCIMRFVWTFSTEVGVGVRLRRAAAAAAEDRLLEEG